MNKKFSRPTNMEPLFVRVHQFSISIVSAASNFYTLFPTGFQPQLPIRRPKFIVAILFNYPSDPLLQTQVQTLFFIYNFVKN